MLPFTNDDNAFGRFALELLHADKDIRNLKQVGVDGVSAIYNGFQDHFPDLGRLLCVHHLSKRDESQLVKLLVKIYLNASQKQKSSSKILKDIYGNRAGCFMSLASLRLLINLILTLSFSFLKKNGNQFVNSFMIYLKEKEVMILWLTLFRAQDSELMLKACTSKTT